MVCVDGKKVEFDRDRVSEDVVHLVSLRSRVIGPIRPT